MLDKYVVFTRHSLTRLAQWNISLAKANYLVYTGAEEKLEKYSRKGKRYEPVRYVRNGPIIFTIKEAKDRNTGDDIYLVLSVYDQTIGLDTDHLPIE